MKNFSSNNETKVDGKMSEQDAGKVGKLQAYAYIIAASGGAFIGLAAIIAAIAQLVK